MAEHPIQRAAVTKVPAKTLSNQHMTPNPTRPASRFRALLSAGLLLVTLLSTQAAPLQMIDIGTLNGHDSYAEFVNNSGLVVGTSEPYMFAWDSTHGMTSIDGINADFRYLRSLTDSGYAMGYFFSYDGSYGGFIWSRSTGTLRIPDFGQGLVPEAINESGQVVGSVNKLGIPYPYVWDPIHGIETIDFPGQGVGINASGQITIWGKDNAGYVWDRVHGLIGLGSIDGSAVYPRFINDAGEVACYVQMGDRSVKLSIWERTTGLTEIATIPPGMFMMLSADINSFDNNGQMLGQANFMIEPSYAFVADRTHGLRIIAQSTRLSSPNNAGIACGYGPGPDGSTTALVWDSAMGIRYLESSDAIESYALSINSRGQVVGDTTGNSQSHGSFLWDQANGMQNIGGFGGTYTTANQISDAGIIGTSQLPTGQYHAFFIPLSTGSAPDLQISAVSAVNNQAPQGSKVTIFATVKNSGTGNAAATTTLITANGATLGSIATPAIAAGQSVTVSVDWRTAAQNGDYTLTARADSANAVSESSESNNTKSIAVTLKGNKIR